MTTNKTPNKSLDDIKENDRCKSLKINKLFKYIRSSNQLQSAKHHSIHWTMFYFYEFTLQASSVQLSQELTKTKKNDDYIVISDSRY